METVIAAIQKTPIPTILILGGLLFILLGFVTKLGGIIEVSTEQKRLAIPVGLFVLFIGLLFTFIPAPYSKPPTTTISVPDSEPPLDKAQEEDDCGHHLLSGTSYKDWHQGPTLQFTGQIKIESTYQCSEGTCFSAEMSFDNYAGGVDKAKGFWSGSHFELRRFVAAPNNAQVWSGTCMPNSVKGNWYIENERSNKGPFSITY